MGIDRDDAVDLAPTITLAKLYEKQGLLDKAAAVYKKLLSIEPDRTDLREALKDLERRLEGQRAHPRESEGTMILSHLRKWERAIHSRKRMLDKQRKKEGKILVIHGSNLDMLGRQDPSLYGDVTLEEIDREITHTAEACGMSADTFQSNHEQELVKKIYEASDGYDVLIINPAAYTHTGMAIREAILVLDIPIIEVHLSNIYRQEPSRQKSLVADVVTAQLAGFGKEGYTMAVRAAADMVAKQGV